MAFLLHLQADERGPEIVSGAFIGGRLFFAPAKIRERAQAL